MRALLIVNPNATATNSRVRDVLASALGSAVKLDDVATRHRNHAIELAASAAADGIDVVVVLGGDGTVNEVANGLAGTETAMAVVPGGSTNVFARAIGMPNSPVEATAEIMEALRLGRRHSVNLGLAGDRYFTFCAGVGLDADVVRVVERHRRKGRRATPGRYVRSAVSHFFVGADRRTPAVTLTVPGAAPVSGLFNVIVANGAPWTYLGGRRVDPCPDADIEGGLDALAMKSLRTVPILNVVRQMLDRRLRLHSRAAYQLHDVDSFLVETSRPLGVQVDGDYIGETESVRFASAPGALTVIA